MEEVKTQNDMLTRKVEELEFILHKSHKRSTLFDNVNKRLIESDAERKMLEVKMDNSFKNFHAEHSTIKDKMHIFDENIANLTTKITEYTAEANKFHSEMVFTKNEINKEVGEINIELKEEIDKLDKKVKDIQESQK